MPSPFMDNTLASPVESLLRKHVGAQGHFEWSAITRGGSDREFYRVRTSTGTAWVVMSYSTTREENALYVDIAGFLQGIGVRVPQILFHDKHLHLVGLEDLGDVSLHALVHQSADRTTVASLYKAALSEVRKLHGHTASTVPTMHGFDTALYRWEREYFLDNLVKRWAGIHLSGLERAEIEAEGDLISSELLKIPRCLIHRDFQSQNLIVRGEKVWLIDFQGMRLGHAAYDVASLLYDPYVSLDPSLREELLQAYAPYSKSFETAFYQTAAQRLMQALGAYGFLGLVRGKTNFLQHIPRGLDNLQDALEHLHGVEKTRKLVHRIQVERQLGLNKTPLRIP